MAFSWAKRVRRPEIRDQQVFMARQTSLRNAAYWSYSNLLAGASRPLHRGYILLRYEDFIRRPTEALRKICTALGEDRADLSFLTGHRVTLDRPNHILKGNPSRFATGPLDLEADEEWRSAMPSTQKLAVTLIAAPLLLRYGYLGRGSTKLGLRSFFWHHFLRYLAGRWKRTDPPQPPSTVSSNASSKESGPE